LQRFFCANLYKLVQICIFICIGLYCFSLYLTNYIFAFIKQLIAVATYRGKMNLISKVMSIQEIIQSGANVSITVGTNDLLQFANHLIRSTKEELESTILTKQKETYVTPDEASVQLHVDRSTLWRWAKTGYLIPVEVGGKRLYKQSDIDIILNK